MCDCVDSSGRNILDPLSLSFHCCFIDLEPQDDAQPSPKRAKLSLSKQGSPIKPALVAKPGHNRLSPVDVDDDTVVKIEIESTEPAVHVDAPINDELYKGKSPETAKHRRRLIRAVANVYKSFKHTGKLNLSLLIGCLMYYSGTFSSLSVELQHRCINQLQKLVAAEANSGISRTLQCKFKHTLILCYAEDFARARLKKAYENRLSIVSRKRRNKLTPSQIKRAAARKQKADEKKVFVIFLVS